MLKSDLVRRISDQNRQLYERDVENIVNAILGEIIAALARGDRVEIRGFGTFTIRNRRARIAQNPQTGRTVAIEKKVWPYFKTGKEDARAAKPAVVRA
jgi:integration host factor subunit beta